MAEDQVLNVVVAYVSPQQQELIAITLPLNSTLEQAIKKSGILQKCNDIDLARNSLGVNGKIADRHQVLRDDDRVEIYRPLRQEPMRARRKRAESQK